MTSRLAEQVNLAGTREEIDVQLAPVLKALKEIRTNDESWSGVKTARRSFLPPIDVREAIDLLEP